MIDINTIGYDSINRLRKKAWGLKNRLATGVKRLATLGGGGAYDAEIIKREDQLSRLFYKIGMASSLEDGKKVTQELVNKRLYYNKYYYLIIEEAKDESDNKVYKLSTSYVCLGMAYM